MPQSLTNEEWDKVTNKVAGILSSELMGLPKIFNKYNFSVSYQDFLEHIETHREHQLTITRAIQQQSFLHHNEVIEMITSGELTSGDNVRIRSMLNIMEVSNPVMFGKKSRASTDADQQATTDVTLKARALIRLQNEIDGETQPEDDPNTEDEVDIDKL